jgi:hypothetical protein
MDTATLLQDWFAKNSDGEWEHQHGVKIETIDNPGWSVHIDLKGRPADGAQFERIERGSEESEGGWIVCDVRDGVFEGFGGPGNLTEILGTFLSWAARAQK